MSSSEKDILSTASKADAPAGAPLPGAEPDRPPQKVGLEEFDKIEELARGPYEAWKAKKDKSKNSDPGFLGS